ncbi:MAG: hypothetical protein M3020_19515 [Myxococcota bacterium]|nr:hypothetical protein [Myxococcota bacterium]
MNDYRCAEVEHQTFGQRIRGSGVHEELVGDHRADALASGSEDQRVMRIVDDQVGCERSRLDLGGLDSEAPITRRRRSELLE